VTLLLLDTTFLIDAERSDVEADRIIADEDDVAIAAISVAELRVGVELARPAHREAREAFFNSIIETIPILDYDTEVALDHAALLAAMHSAGRPRGANDLIIAATARSTSRTIISSDASAFADLPGVLVLT